MTSPRGPPDPLTSWNPLSPNSAINRSGTAQRPIDASELSVGQTQLAEPAKVLLLNARCVILDEPSAVEAPPEALRLCQLLRRLAACWWC